MSRRGSRISAATVAAIGDDDHPAGRLAPEIRLGAQGEQQPRQGDGGSDRPPPEQPRDHARGRRQRHRPGQQLPEAVELPHPDHRHHGRVHPGHEQQPEHAQHRARRRQRPPVADEQDAGHDRDQHVAAPEHRRPGIHQQRPRAMVHELVGVGDDLAPLAAADRDPPDPAGDGRRRHPGHGDRHAGGTGGGQMGAPRAGQDARHQREAGDGVGRVHERDHGDHGRARIGPQQHAPQRGQEQDHDRRSQHEERERGRLVDLHDQPVDQRAQIPGGHDGGEVAGQPPAGQPLGHRVDAEDRRQAAERRQLDERRPGIDAGDPGDAGPGRVQQREGVAGVRRAVLERRDGRQREPVDVLDLAHPPDVEQRVADHAGGQPPGQERERHRRGRSGGDLDQRHRLQGEGTAERVRHPAPAQDQHGRQRVAERQGEQERHGQRHRPHREAQSERHRDGAGHADVALQAEQPDGRPAGHEHDDRRRAPHCSAVEGERPRGEKPQREQPQDGHFGSGAHRGASVPAVPTGAIRRVHVGESRPGRPHGHLDLLTRRGSKADANSDSRRRRLSWVADGDAIFRQGQRGRRGRRLLPPALA